MFECRRLLLVAVAALAAIGGTAGSEAPAVPVSTTYSPEAPRLHILVAKRSVGPAQAAGLSEEEALAASRLRRRSRLERRQASTPTLIGEPRINVLLGKRHEGAAAARPLEKRQDGGGPALFTAPRVNVLLAKRAEPAAAASRRLEKRQDGGAGLVTAPRINVLLGKRDGSGTRLRKRQTAANGAGAAAAGTAAAGTPTGTAAGTSTRAPAAAPTPKEGGVLSPIQFRPIALQLSMPFSMAGLALTFILFFLMFRGSAAIDDQARRAMQKSTVARAGKL